MFDDCAGNACEHATGVGRLQIRDVTTRTALTTVFLGSSGVVLDVATVNDMNLNGYTDIAVLSRESAGTALVRVYDSSTGALLKNVFFNTLQDPVGFAVLPDFSGNAVDEIAVMGTALGIGQLQIKDAQTGALLNSIDFP